MSTISTLGLSRPVTVVRQPRWAAATNILCVRLDNLGDVLMTTPALRALKQSSPTRRLTLLTSTSAASAAAYIPEVDDVCLYDAPWVKHSRDAGVDCDLSIVSALRSMRFDAAVIFTVYSQSALPAALLCRLIGIPLRLGYSRENPYSLLTDWVEETEPLKEVRHEVERQLHLVGTVGATTADRHLSFRVREEDRDRVALMLKESGVEPQRPWVLLHPGATAESRRYPADRFAQVADALHERLSCPLVFGGSRAECALVEGIRASMSAPSVSLCGRLNIGECAAAISMARVLIANNSGPVHLAAATGTPVVDIYAMTNPQHTPWNVLSRTLTHNVPCKYCYRSVCPKGHHLCLRGIPVESVVTAAEELFATQSRIVRISDAWRRQAQQRSEEALQS